MKKHISIILIIFIILILFICNATLPHLYWKDLATCGTFGDQFGAVNALFSGLTFAGLIYTIILQKQELSLQREELKLTREEMHNQTEIFDTQNKMIQVQRFENTFFQMMELQQQIVNGLEITINNFKSFQHVKAPELSPEPEIYTYKGRDVFERAWTNMGNGKKCLSEQIIDLGIDAYCTSETRTIFDHYFRHLYTILNFIDKTRVFDTKCKADSFMQKYQYAKILRSTLSRYELVLLYYIGISRMGKGRFKILIEKYSMLKNINISLLSFSKDVTSRCIDKEQTNIVTYMRDHGYELSDYYFFITEEKDDINKYNLSAFYHGKDELEMGCKKLQGFNEVLKDYLI